MEVEKITGIHAKPLIDDRNQFFYIKEGEEWVVMKRLKTRPPKVHKRYKTERGARNHAYHMNIN